MYMMTFVTMFTFGSVPTLTIFHVRFRRSSVLIDEINKSLIKSILFLFFRISDSSDYRLDFFFLFLLNDYNLLNDYILLKVLIKLVVSKSCWFRLDFFFLFLLNGYILLKVLIKLVVRKSCWSPLFNGQIFIELSVRVLRSKFIYDLHSVLSCSFLCFIWVRSDVFWFSNSNIFFHFLIKTSNSFVLVSLLVISTLYYNFLKVFES